VAAGLFFGFGPVRIWTGLARVDSLALLLSMAGWGVFVYVRRLRWLGALVMVAAVFAKQSMLAAPVAAVAALALAGERRAALLHLAGMVAVGAAILAALQVATHGAFGLDAGVALLNKWQAALFLSGLSGFGKSAPGVLVTAALVCAVGARDHELRPVALYAAAAGLVVLSAGKVGASFNYYLEFCAVASLSLGLLLGRRWAVKSERLSPIFYLSVLAIVQIALTARMPIVPAGPTQDSGAPAMAVQGRGRGSAALTAAVAAEPGEVLSECMGPVVQAGKVLWVEPFVTTQLAVAGWWDQGPLLAMIRHRQFGLVVMSDFELRRPPGANIDVRWTEDERAAMARNYTPVARVGEFWLLRPRMATPPAGSSASQLQGNGEPGEAVGLSGPG
jgi:hypothetical protein